MDDETEHEALYGDRAGNWLLIRSPLNLLPPPSLTAGVPLQGTVDLTYLGSPGDVVIRLYNWLTDSVKVSGVPRAGNAAPPVQDVLATLLGVGQQAVSRYLSGGSRPRLASEGWRRLVRATFAPLSVAQLFPRAAVDPSVAVSAAVDPQPKED